MEDQVIFTEFLPVTVFCSLTSNLKLLTTTCGVKYCCNQFSPKEATFKPFFCQFNFKQWLKKYHFISEGYKASNFFFHFGSCDYTKSPTVSRKCT